VPGNFARKEMVPGQEELVPGNFARKEMVPGSKEMARKWCQATFKRSGPPPVVHRFGKNNKISAGYLGGCP
jgi:hypothetical protein